MKSYFYFIILILFICSSLNFILVDKKVNLNLSNVESKLIVNSNEKHTNKTTSSLQCSTCTNFLFYSTNICKKNNNNIILAYMMISVSQFKLRNYIRNTWANRKLNSNLRLVFIIGHSNDLKSNRLIQEENLKHNDLVQGDFVDTYRNLTYKSLVAWKWIIKYCSNAKLLIKIDHDRKINMNSLFQFFSINTLRNRIYLPYKKTFFCNYVQDGIPLKNKTSKWYVSDYEYNLDLYNMTSYPIYCLGSYYIMTRDLVEDLYDASFRTKIFWIEDVYTGLLAKNIPNVNYVSIKSEDIIDIFNFKSLKVKKEIFL